MNVQIMVWPQITTISPQFRRAMIRARNARAASFDYKGVTFHHAQLDIYTILNGGLDAQLPEIFREELTVNFVSLSSDIPAQLKPKPGRYAGKNFGFSRIYECCVDPKGVTSNGKPMLYVTGGMDSFDDVVKFFRRVMTGKLTPGYNGDPWSLKVYRH